MEDRQEVPLSSDQTRTPAPATKPEGGPNDEARMEAADLGPHAPASPYPKTDKAPETGGYEAPPRLPGDDA